MELFEFPHLETERSVAHVGLFTAVENAATLRKRIIGAATAEGPAGEGERDAVNFAFIDACLITSTLHLQTAIYQAVLAASQGSLRTKTVHSEILWALNPTNNITEAIRRYGVSDISAALIVVRIGGPQPPASEVEKGMEAVVKGNLVPFSELEHLTDWAAIKKYHKLNNEVAIRETKDSISHEHFVVDNIVVSTVAMKSVVA